MLSERCFDIKVVRYYFICIIFDKWYDFFFFLSIVVVLFIEKLLNFIVGNIMDWIFNYKAIWKRESFGIFIVFVNSWELLVRFFKLWLWFKKNDFGDFLYFLNVYIRFLLTKLVKVFLKNFLLFWPLTSKLMAVVISCNVT